MDFTGTGKRQWRAFWIGFVLLAVGAASFFYWGGKKEVWFCDEIYTYESSNGFEQDWPAVYTGEWMTGADVEAFFAADSEELNLENIMVLLYNDHVPLYFWLFRIVSFFFFKGSGSIWIGLWINLVFYLLFLGLGYGVFRRLTGRDFLSGSLMFFTCVVNRLMIEQATVLRMYMMLLLAEGLLLLCALGTLRDARQGRMSPWIFLGLYGSSLAGFLTHYDYWIFYAATAALFCGWLLLSALRRCGKRFWSAWEFRHVAAWVGNFLLSILTTIYVFPYCRWNLNKGKGQTALYSLFDFSAEKWEQILWGYQRMSVSLFGEKVPAALGLSLLFGCIGGGIFVLFRRKENLQAAGLALVVLAAQFYQLIVCFTMPDAWEERYLWCVYTIIALCGAWGGVLVLGELIPRGKIQGRQRLAGYIGACVLGALVLAGELLVIDGGRGVAYLFHPEKDVALLKEHSGIPWVVYGPTVGVYSYYDWIIPEQICFLTQEHTQADREAAQKLKEGEFVLYLYEGYLSEALAFFERETGRTLSASHLTRSTNLDVYLVESGQESTGE